MFRTLELSFLDRTSSRVLRGSRLGLVFPLLWKANAEIRERGGPTPQEARGISLSLSVAPRVGASFSSVPFLLDRVQKEQLAAIFKLMQDNKETFGEMSDGDVQEQLRLYDM